MSRPLQDFCHVRYSYFCNYCKMPDEDYPIWMKTLSTARCCGIMTSFRQLYDLTLQRNTELLTRQ